MLRLDPAIEEIGIDVAELGHVSEEFLEAVREDIKLKRNKKYFEALPEVYDENDDEHEIKTDLDEEDDDYHDYALRKELKGEAYIF